MGSQGPNSGGTFASDNTVGTIAITNPSNAGASDNAYATAVLLLSQITNYLKATNFGFNIPADAAITGVLVEIEKSATVLSSMVDNSVKLVKGAVISGTEKASAVNWGTSDGYTSYGGDGDMWGLALTPADVNASNFGVVISATDLIAATAQIDHVRITVFFTGSNKPGNMLRRLSVGNGMSRCEGAT